MALWLQGLQIGDRPVMTQMREALKSNVNTTSFYGSDAIEVEMVSLGGKEYQISILLDNCSFDDPDSKNAIEYLENAIQGLIHRNAPVFAVSDDHPLHGGSKEIFLAIKDYNVNWTTGTRPTDMSAVVNITAEFLGTPSHLMGRYCVSVLHRGSDYEGIIPSRSTVGLPETGGSFVSTIFIPTLEARYNTKMSDIGNPDTGFANDTLTALDGDVEVGDILFPLDNTNQVFLNNAVKVYDEGLSPRLRVTNKEHLFVGNLVIETELYRIVIVNDPTNADDRVELFAGTGTGNYEVTAFETIRMGLFNKMNTIVNQDEFVRVRFDTGNYLEIERGKDPVIHLAGAFDSFQLVTNQSSDVPVAGVGHAIINADESADTITVSGDQTGTFTGGATLYVMDRLDDGTYTVASSVYNAGSPGETVITLNEDLTDTATDGFITTARNWASLGGNVYIASNYDFLNTSGLIKQAVGARTNQVFSIIYEPGDFVASGRFREVLVEIS